MKQFRSDWKMPPIGEGRREGSEPGGTENREFLIRGMEWWGEERGVVIWERVQAEGSKVEGKKNAFEETVRKEEKHEGSYLQCGRGEQEEAGPQFIL